MIDEATIELYGPLLQRAIEIVTADATVKIGAAINQAALQLGLNVPQDIQDAIAVCAFKIICNGLPTKVDA